MKYYSPEPETCVVCGLYSRHELLSVDTEDDYVVLLCVNESCKCHIVLSYPGYIPENILEVWRKKVGEKHD